GSFDIKTPFVLDTSTADSSEDLPDVIINSKPDIKAILGSLDSKNWKINWKVVQSENIFVSVQDKDIAGELEYDMIRLTDVNKDAKTATLIVTSALVELIDMMRNKDTKELFKFKVNGKKVDIWDLAAATELGEAITGQHQTTEKYLPGIYAVLSIADWMNKHKDERKDGFTNAKKLFEELKKLLKDTPLSIDFADSDNSTVQAVIPTNEVLNDIVTALTMSA
ncbi:hypothetical protein KKC59_03680, partial [bacterium]|nr:hypothetical protein [bacterium]